MARKLTNEEQTALISGILTAVGEPEYGFECVEDYDSSEDTPDWEKFEEIITQEWTVAGLSYIDTTTHEREECQIIFSWRGFHYKVEGWYSSYSGYALEDEEIYEVVPQEKTVTIYV